MTKLLTEEDSNEIVTLLVGRRVQKIADDVLQLDDGTTLKLVGHDGGCSCEAGCYDLTELNDCDNVITNVEVVNDPGGDGYGHYDGSYKIFVYVDNRRINLATFEGTDGNGYYGTGFSIYVRKPTDGTTDA